MTNSTDTLAVPAVEPRHRMRIALEWGHVSVQQMADEIGVDRNTVGNYLAGRTKPRRSDLRVWALRCGVPLEWIEYGIGPDDRGDGGSDLGVSSSPWMTDDNVITFPIAA